MKIGYFGTPEHSAKLLKSLCDNGYEISFVVTNMDKPQGRDRKLSYSPVKMMANKWNIPVLQFPNLKDDLAFAEITSFQAEIYIVYAYGSIIPSRIFLHPPAKTINLHGSILPEFRGASPIQAAILNGKKETGITLQYITDQLDAGDIISINKLMINDDDTFGALLEKLTDLGTEEILKVLNTYSGVKFPSFPQDHSKASFCKKIKSEERKLDFSEQDIELHNKVRAFNPGNICFTSYREKRLNVYKTKISDINSESPIGSIHVLDKKTFGVVCGNKKVLIMDEIQFENKKVIKGVDFINGCRPNNGDLFI
jgi:methionyl-tRNA formyltransferase